MNLQAIVVANATGFVLLLFLLISRLLTRTKLNTEERVFTLMMVLVMIACVVEPVTFAVDGCTSRIGRWINLLGNSFLYYANGLGAFMWLIYVDLNLFHDRKRLKKIYFKLSIPVGILLLTLVGNIFFKYYFYVDENGVYHRQPTIYIFYIYVMFCAVYSLTMYIYYRRKMGRVAFFPIYMYLIPIVTGSVLQMLIYGISTAWLGTAVALVALSMSLQQQRSYIDNLTNLFNRQYLEHAIFSINRRIAQRYYGIMLDMNDFKEINDNYGHSVGDQALRDMADIIRNSVKPGSMAFRYAGDEFIIIVKTDNENDVIDLEKGILERVARFNETGERPYTLSVAMGHDRFESVNDSEDRFLQKIDTAMYEDKRRTKTK